MTRPSINQRPMHTRSSRMAILYNLSMTKGPSTSLPEVAVDRAKRVGTDVPRRHTVVGHHVEAVAPGAKAATAESPWAAIRSSLVQWADIFQLAASRLDHLISEAQGFGKNGWPLNPSLSANEVAWIVDASAKAEYGDVFVELYDSDKCSRLNRLFADLVSSSTLTQWRPIIVQAQDGFDRGQYALLVPALLTVLEGEMFLSPTRHTNVRNRCRKILASQDPAGFGRIVWQSIVDFIDELFAQSDFTSKEPRLNRNWALHGRAAVVWNRQDVIRLLHGIHTIDTINAHAVNTRVP